MKFLRHLPCPRCGSKDNLGEYDDHFFCFGCKYYKPKDDITSIKLRRAQKEPTDLRNTQIETVEEIPINAKQWLFQYGIKPSEIKDFGISWNEEHELLVLLKTPSYWQARTFGKHKVKYMSSGQKPLTFYGYSDKLVCVEDILSAIKISRLSPEWCALPLLGSHLAENVSERLGRDFSSVVIWLDYDKAKESISIARMLKERSINATSLITKEDPKEYSTDEIKKLLDKY